jgi:hypothetical protein
MAKRKDYERTEETMATEESPGTEERRRIVEEYVNDLHEILKKLRKLFG